MNVESTSPPNARSASRRNFMGQLGLGAAFFAVRGAFAEELARRTAWVEEGPFYPPRLPLDTDNDLIIVNDSITPAIGEVAHVSGRLLDGRGDPIRNATIEIWNTDSQGIYLADRGHQARYDAHFQGFGRFLTSSNGEYYFRTLKPVPYGGRQAPHIHFKIKLQGQRDWTTQLFVKGHPGNARDGIYARIADQAARDSVTVDFTSVKDSRIGEVTARFDIVMGATPHDDHTS
jgi:protocatechuate 3,4-dioxygenase beta subunit